MVCGPPGKLVPAPPLTGHRGHSRRGCACRCPRVHVTIAEHVRLEGSRGASWEAGERVQPQMVARSVKHYRRFPFSFLLPASRRGCPSAAPGKCGSDPALGSRTRIPRSLRTSSRGVMMAWPLRCNGSRAHFPGVCLWNTGRSPSPEGPGRRGLSGQCPSLEPEAPAEIEGGVPVDAPQPLLSPGSEGTRVAAGVQQGGSRRRGPSAEDARSGASGPVRRPRARAVAAPRLLPPPRRLRGSGLGDRWLQR